MKSHRGFTLIEVMLVIVILAIIGLVGWRVWEANQISNDTQDSSVVAQPEIKNASDLDEASKDLDSTNVVGNYEQELDAETDF